MPIRPSAMPMHPDTMLMRQDAMPMRQDALKTLRFYAKLSKTESLRFCDFRFVVCLRRSLSTTLLSKKYIASKFSDIGDVLYCRGLMRTAT
ncbi:hypothetical protein [Nostoc sp.]|uniref:hypothetical protein n=1 Tax=Nostoc sp. TaxID=1180 RepID=UPI002FFD35F6